MHVDKSELKNMHGWSWKDWLKAAGVYETMDTNDLEQYRKLTDAWERGESPYKFKIDE